MLWSTLVLLTITLAKVRAKLDRLGAIPSFKGILDGRLVGISACCVRDDVRVLLVQWYLEVHMDGNSFVLGGHLINLQFVRLWSFLADAGAS